MTTTRRRAAAIVIGALSLGLSACGSDGKRPLTVPMGVDQTFSPSPAASPRSTPRSPSPATKPAAKKAARPAAAGSGPSPVALPWTPSPEVPVDATLSPTCFQRGGTVTLTVHTKPKSGVGYIAVYSDNGTGAPKPTGSGYGGNASGFSDTNGDYRSVFTVSLDAPPGPGRVDVFVAWKDNKWGYAGPAFEVAGPDGRC